ncbi:uncharacterized protein BDW47DRAFT_22230 [Aspergillus candidus]|uniref:PBP domain-containing protein n=1 Tax=Aspergillus candidus TaxID=41067 RepID=A0A2I2FDI9_ASPCN|nr:hypothetical protein BDW47DRAFT_22230 [Aspergillus candidus]PLB38703.1 hypothetical protein BDW47DRAFT_22230 [Aspergillus candidus]
MRFLGLFPSYSLGACLGVLLYTGAAVADVYDGGCTGSSSVKLRIGNGGAGQSGLVKELSDRFIKNQTDDCRSHNLFKVEWVKGDTTETISNMGAGKVDIGITYSAAAEEIAIKSGTAKGCKYRGNATSGMPCFGECKGHTERPCYTFRDHFYLAGPKNNTPEITSSDDISVTFSKLYNAAENGTARFLSRYDKSATNIKDAQLWINIGQVPWATAYSKWYHQYVAYPVQALKAAILLEEFTITDRGTFLTLRDENEGLTNRAKIYKSGDKVSELLNPADIIISTKAKGETDQLAMAFIKWALGGEGQAVIANFQKKDKYCLYKGYPGGPTVSPSCKWDIEGQSREPDRLDGQFDL